MIIQFLCLILLIGQTFASELEVRVDAIVSIFENGSPVIQYPSIINIHDGRGYTAGKAGFTTANGDLLDVVQLYLKTHPGSDFKALESALIDVAKKESGQTRHLHQLPKIWKNACKNKDFISSQDQVVEKLYKTPARVALKKYNFKSPLTYLVFYDSLIQHGEGLDPDSFSGIIQKMDYQGANESLFLRSFLKSRLMILQNSSAADTRRVWRESVDRVYALQKLIQENHWELNSPFSLKVWNEQFNF